MHCSGTCFSYFVCALSCIWLFVIPWTVAHQAPLSMEFFQARILEPVATFYSRGSSWPSDWTWVSSISCVSRRILYHGTTWEALSYFAFCLTSFSIYAYNPTSVFTEVFLGTVAPWDFPSRKRIIGPSSLRWKHCTSSLALSLGFSFSKYFRNTFDFVNPDFSPDIFDHGAQGTAVKRSPLLNTDQHHQCNSHKGFCSIPGGWTILSLAKLPVGGHVVVASFCYYKNDK